MKESPIVIGPRMDSVVLCLGCYKSASDSKNATRLCEKCNVAPVCCTECEIKSHHAGLECNAFSKIFKGNPSFNSLASYMEIIMPFRCLLMRPEPEAYSEKWENFLKLESHSLERENTPIWHHNEKKVVSVS